MHGQPLRFALRSPRPLPAHPSHSDEEESVDVKLALKLTLTLLVVFPCALLLGIRVQRELEIEWYEQARSRDLESLALALRAGVEQAFATDGQKSAESFIKHYESAEQGSRLRLLSPAELARQSGAEHLAAQLSTLKAGDHLAWSDHSTEPSTISSYTLLGLGNSPQLGLWVVRPMISEEPYIHATLAGFAETTGGMTLLAVFIAMGIGNHLITRPLQSIITQARRVGAGDLSVTFSISQKDEMGTLAGELNNMVRQLADAHRRIAEEAEARIRTIEQLRWSDRLGTVGTLAAGIAHELGTPLHVAGGRARRIATTAGVPDSARHDAEVVRAQCDRMRGIVQQFLGYARRPSTELRAVSVNQLVHKVASLLQPVAHRKGSRFQLELAKEETLVPMHAELLEQALTNVAVNALQAMPEGGAVTVSTQRIRRPSSQQGTDALEQEWLCIGVEDEGTGISAEVRDRMFDPFFTTKQVGEGTGLGLFIAYGIVQEHGGFMDVKSDEGKGARIDIYLPWEGAA